MYLCNSQTYQIAGPLKFPFAFSLLPHLRVGGVHDGDQYVDHQHAHDDLVGHPDDDAHGMGELQGKVLIVGAECFHVNSIMVVCVQHPPKPLSEEASDGFEVVFYERVVCVAVLLVRLLERLEQGPGAHGVGAPHDQIDEEDADDVPEHPGYADHNRTKAFDEDKTAQYPEKRKLSLSLETLLT